MIQSCVPRRGEIGAYLVDALDSRARKRIARHLAVCPGCQAAYDELVPVRDSLNLLALGAGGPEPSPATQREPALRGSSLADLIAGAGPEILPLRTAGTPPAARPVTRRRLMTAGATVAAAASAAAAVAVLAGRGAAVRMYSAADRATGVSGQARITGTRTGTQIDLTATGLPGDQRCVLVAVANSRSEITRSWNTTHYGSARITVTTTFLAGQLTALRIESGTDVVLLNIRV